MLRARRGGGTPLASCLGLGELDLGKKGHQCSLPGNLQTLAQEKPKRLLPAPAMVVPQPGMQASLQLSLVLHAGFSLPFSSVWSHLAPSHFAMSPPARISLAAVGTTWAFSGSVPFIISSRLKAFPQACGPIGRWR